MPPAAVEEFFDGLVPSEAEELAAADDEDSLRRALELDPRNAQAARKLARILIGRGEATRPRARCWRRSRTTSRPPASPPG